MRREGRERMGKVSVRAGLLLLVAAAAWASSARAADSPALRESSGAERERVAKLVEEARKEGEVVWLSHSVDPEFAVRIEAGFRGHYGLEGFRLRHSLMRTGPLAARVLQAARADARDTDIIHTSDFELFRDLLRRNLLLKYDSPEFAHYHPMAIRGDGPIAAAPGYFTSALVVYADVAYNTKHVKGLAAYEDMLDPAYRGRIVVGDASKSATHLYTYMGLRQKLSRGFWERLARQEPALIVSVRDMINRMGAGEYWIGLFVHARHVYVGAGRGLPLAAKPLQPDVGVVLTGYPWGILSRAPHPSAAKLLTDYFHRRETQQMLVQAMGYTPSRLDVELPAEARKFSPPLQAMPPLIPIAWKTVTQEELQSSRDEFREIFYGRR